MICSEKAFLSEIIEVLNETYGQDLTDEHKVHFEHVVKRGEQNEEIKQAFQNDNSEANRKFIVEKVIDQIFLSYVNDNFDFYKAVTQGQQKEFVMEVLYEAFKDRFGRGKVR